MSPCADTQSTSIAGNSCSGEPIELNLPLLSGKSLSLFFDTKYVECVIYNIGRDTTTRRTDQ